MTKGFRRYSPSTPLTYSLQLKTLNISSAANYPNLAGERRAARECHPRINVLHGYAFNYYHFLTEQAGLFPALLTWSSLIRVYGLGFRVSCMFCYMVSEIGIGSLEPLGMLEPPLI